MVRTNGVVVVVVVVTIVAFSISSRPHTETSEQLGSIRGASIHRAATIISSRRKSGRSRRLHLPSSP